MKLASLDDGSRDGRLLVVARDLGRAVDASGIAATLQLALEHWPQVEARLQALYQRLNDNQVAEAFDLLAPAIRTMLYRQLPPHLRQVPVLIGAFGPQAGLVGAAFAAARGAQWWTLS